MRGSRRSNAAAVARYERRARTPGRITDAQADAFAELSPEQATIVFEHFLAASEAEGGAAGPVEPVRPAGSAGAETGAGPRPVRPERGTGSGSGSGSGSIDAGAGAGSATKFTLAEARNPGARAGAGEIDGDPTTSAEQIDPTQRRMWPFLAKVVAAAAAATILCGLLLVAFAPRAETTPAQFGSGSAGSGSSSSSTSSSVGQLGLDRSDPLGTSVWSSDW
jgi:hypothetical protein